MKRLRRMLRSDEAGFTMVELLLASSIGLVVLGSATLITIGASRHNSEVANRTEATQRGRGALERMQQLLRSQVCATATDPPITDARANTVTFTTDLSDGSRPIERHTFTFDAANRRLLDSRWVGAGSPVTFTGAPQTRTLANSVDRQGSGAVFRYYGYPSPLPTTGIVEPSFELVPPADGTLDPTALVRVARVDIAFTTTGATTSTRNIRAPMTNQVFVRLADPDSGSADPSCT